MRTLGAVGAQIAAELKTRLRSPATLVALLAAFAGSLLWIPNPAGRVTSLSWTTSGGREEAPVYSAAYVGFAASLVVTILVTWLGFYLVAGAIRRDRERRIGAILAATPLSSGQYLLGKLAAHVAYLMVIAAMALAAGVVAFARFGQGRFSLLDFFGPSLLISIPAVVVTASLAILFDVVPGLSGRAGLVIWFFFFFLLAFFPMWLSGGGAGGEPRHLPMLDPAGIATQTWLARQTVSRMASMSTGLIVHDRPVVRVAWPGIAVTGRLVAARLISLMIAFLPLALAIPLFDRFDPARKKRRPSRRKEQRSVPVPAPADAAFDSHRGGPLLLAPVRARPTFWRAVLAETRLIWDDAGWTKWALLGASLAAAFLPEPATRAAIAAFLILLIPAVSEVAAREEISGTEGLIFSQPGIPSSPVLWKAVSIAAFLLLMGAPAILRSLTSSSAGGLGLVAGLLFVASSAAGLGALTSGGKLFSALYLILWYASVNRLQAADFTAVLSARPEVATSGVYLLLGAISLGAAVWRERLRKA